MDGSESREQTGSQVKPGSVKLRFLIVLLLGAIGVVALYLLSRFNYLLFHSLAEVVSIAMAWGVFSIAWNSRRLTDNHYLIFIGIAYFFVGGIDLFHTLAYTGMGIFSADYGTNLATQFWIAARYLQSASLLVAPLFLLRKLRITPVIIGYSLASVLLLAAIFGGYFPTAFIEGVGLTPFKIASEYVIAVMLMGAIALTVKHRRKFGQNVANYMVISMALAIASEMAFTLYTDAYGITNTIGHLFKIASFYAIYQALIVTGLSRPSELMFTKLRQSEENYRSLFNNMTEGFALHEIILDKAGKPCDYRFLAINQAFERLTGMSAVKVQGKTVKEVIPDIEPYWIETYGKVALTGEPSLFENFSAGLNRWYEVYAYSTQKGQFATNFRDITERKNAEKALLKAHDELEIRVQDRTQELNEAHRQLQAEYEEHKLADETVKAERQRFNAVLDMLPAYVVLLAPDYTVPFANKFFRERFGESHGKRCYEYLFNRTEACENCESYKAMKTNAPHHWEWLGPDNHNYDIYDFPFTDIDGTNLIMEMGIDITEQKKMQDALSKAREELEARVRERTRELQKSEEYYRHLIETANEGIWTTEPDGRILFVNQRMADMLGYTREEMLGRVGIDFFIDGDEIVAKARADYRAGRNIKVECRLRHKDGSTIWVIVNGAPLHDDRGRHETNLALFTDITDRKEAEAEIAHLASFPELNPNPVVELDIAGDIDYLNPSARALFPDLAITGKQHQLLADWESFAGAARDSEKKVKVREINVGDKWYLQTLSYVPPSDRFRLYARDITPIKLIEEDLRETTDYLENLFNYANAPIIVWDPQLKITRFNHAFERLTGRLAGEVIGKELDILFPEQSREESLALIRKAVEGERWEVVEIPILHKDGTVRTVLWNSATLFDTDGKTVVATIAQGQDITERKKAEENLLREKNLTDTIIDSLPGVFYLFDEKGRFLRWNKNWEKVTGYSAAETLQLTPVDLFEGEDKTSIAETIAEVLKKGQSTVEAYFVSKDRRRIPYYFTGSRILLGQTLCVLGMGLDITERKLAEEELKVRSEELARSNAELEQFAYIASHDLQEPLRMVSSYVQLLGKRYQGKLDKDADEFINFARDGATRMQRLITDLLAYSRVGTRGKEFLEVSLETSLAQALDNLKLAITDKGATITHDALPVVFADGGQITQVFQNLIDNAIKFQGNEPPRIHISAEIKGDECVCSVRDNGIGISAEHFKRLFLLFQRLHTKREYPGTGIGLAVCKRIIERHGGRIWVESQPGAGTTFYFSLPLRKG